MPKTHKQNWSTVRIEKWSHDRWSGPELLDRIERRTMKAALNYCRRVNSQNTLPSAPDYYVAAKIVGE